jgi:hypothetical protein
MHYGNKPHVSSPADMTILKCWCGWISREMSVDDMKALGIPWYCDACGKQSLRFVTFAPHERDEAYRAFGLT